MHKLIIVIFSLIVGLVIAFWDIIAPPVGTPISTEEVTAQNTKKLAPDFTFADLDGIEHKLSDYRGKTILLNIWATWCPPCIFEIPQMLELARRDPEGLVFIGLSVDEQAEQISKFLNSLPKDVRANIELSNVLFSHDKDKAISKDLLGVTKYPETLIIDKDGYIKSEIEGVVDWLGLEIGELLKE